MLRMDEVNKIRKAHRNGESINEIATKYSRSWATIKGIVDTRNEDLDKRGKRPNKQCTVITPEVEEAVIAYLLQEEQLKVHRKQRYTATVIFKDLKAKGTYQGSRRRLQHIVKQLREKHGQVKRKSYLPLDFPLGTTAQFDHGECHLTVDGKRVRGYLFICSIPGVSLRYCQVFPTKSKEAWGEFHERSYHFFGGVIPTGIYDNDCVLVKKVIGTQREQTHFSHSLEQHYGITSRFCNPAAGNEKGSVENGVGYCRRNYLPGVPSFEDWQTVNKQLHAACFEAIETGQHYRSGQPLKTLFEEMAKLLKPQSINHIWRRWEEVRVDSYQLVNIDSQSYSVPERYVGTNVRMGLGVFSVQIFSDNVLIAEHSRRFGESGSSLYLEHYLDQLVRKPGALWDCQAVKQHQFSPQILQIWQRLEKRYPQRDANRKFIDILCLGRRHGSNHLIAGVSKALSLDILEPKGIENILHAIVLGESNSEKESLQNGLHYLQFDSWTCEIDQYSQLVGGSQI